MERAREVKGKSGQGAREIMAGVFFPYLSRPVWCHDCNLGQYPAQKEVDAYGAKFGGVVVEE